MQRPLRVVLPALLVLALAAMSLPAGATHNADKHSKMDLLATNTLAAINSDFAFWGDHAFEGFYRNDVSIGGFRIFDISNPASPTLIKTVVCDGLQNDPIVW